MRDSIRGRYALDRRRHVHTILTYGMGVAPITILVRWLEEP